MPTKKTTQHKTLDIADIALIIDCLATASNNSDTVFSKLAYLDLINKIKADYNHLLKQ